MIPERGKLDQLVNHSDKYVGNIVFWGFLLVFFIILYLAFSAFAETKSVVLPLLFTLVFNVSLTAFKAFNSLSYDESTPLMLIPYIVSVLFLAIWLVKRSPAFSIIKISINHLIQIKLISAKKTIGLSVLFIMFALIIPAILEHLIFIAEDLPRWVNPVVVAFIYCIIILLAIIVLTYEPTEVYDVLLINNHGLPIASHIELFQSGDVLISGFFTALSSVSAEIDPDESTLKSIKQGEREILIEDGVLTRIVVLADKDQTSIRNAIIKLHKKFEITNSDAISKWTGQDLIAANTLVSDIGKLSVKFNFPQQTRWLGTLTLIFSPIFIILLGLIG